jgi:phosphonate transport system substrate-binding protein
MVARGIGVSTENHKAAPSGESPSACSRRNSLALLPGAGPWLARALAASDADAPVRVAISESLVADVNLNDARAALATWLNRMMVDLHAAIEFNPKVFDSGEEILRRARGGQVDSVALNVVEYRQIAGVLECVAPAWLNTILEEGHFGPSERFFGSVTTDTNVSRGVLPVFFGQTDACLTSQRGFETMYELNPQVAKDLTVAASSPAMVAIFYVFHKNYDSPNRERFLKVFPGLRSSAAGRQLATLFQFDEMQVRDGSCLASALGVLEMAERARRPAGSRRDSG